MQTRRTLNTLLMLVALSTLSACSRDAAPRIDYSVPGTVPPIMQPVNSNACWAVVSTMMYSWRNNASYTVEYVMRRAGEPYPTIHRNDTGLDGGDKPGLLRALGLRSEAPQSYTIAGWETLLRTHGPIWVTTKETPANLFSVHARIITGIRGDGTAGNTRFTIMDPADGRVHTETIAEFVRKFEAVAQQDLGNGGDLRPQVVHF